MSNAFFLSYRRDDSAGFAGRLADALEHTFGSGVVFRDVDDIGPGEDFIHTIESQLREVGAVLVMIGPHWLAAGADGQRRLDAKDDFVHLEIQLALASNKPLIPLLVGGARMPTEAELPPALAGLARRQAVVLSDAHWHSDVERLVASLHTWVPNARAGQSVSHTRRRLLAGAMVVAGLVGVFAMLRFLPDPSPTSPVPVAARPQTSLGAGQYTNIVGRWTARVKYDWGDEYTEVFEFKYLADALHGTASYLNGRLTIEHATLKGDWLRFTTRSQEGLNDAPWKEVGHHYIGKITPAGIAFTLETTGGYSIHPPVEFIAHRSPSPTRATPSAGG